MYFLTASIVDGSARIESPESVPSPSAGGESGAGCDAKENAKSLDRLFVDGEVEVDECVFRHGKTTPWMPSGTFGVSTGIEYEIQHSEGPASFQHVRMRVRT